MADDGNEFGQGDMRQDNGNKGDLSGSDLQRSQQGGAQGNADTGTFTRDQSQGSGGSQAAGGYGSDQQAGFHQGQQGYAEADQGANRDQLQSRGERYDEQQGGGRGADSISGERNSLGGQQVGGSRGWADQQQQGGETSVGAGPGGLGGGGDVSGLRDEERGDERQDEQGGYESGPGGTGQQQGSGTGQSSEDPTQGNGLGGLGHSDASDIERDRTSGQDRRQSDIERG